MPHGVDFDDATPAVTTRVANGNGHAASSSDSHVDTAPVHKKVVVIGAGISGIVLGAELKRKKSLKNPLEDLIIFDRNGGYGGVWYANTYPGAACDIVSHIYSVSWFQNAWWSRRYSPQDEIRGYYARLAETYGLPAVTRFRHTVLSCEFDERTLLWTVRVRDDETGLITPYITRIVVSAIGQLNRPKYAPIPGREKFEGPQWHTAEWNESVDLTGKTVAIIGTGPSAGQVIPTIADKVKELHVFQRSPPHVLPRDDYVIPRWMQWIFRLVPGVWWLHHMYLYIKEEIIPYAASHIPSQTNLDASAVCRNHLYSQIPASRQDLRDKLSPTYPFGCKRPLFLDNFHPTFLRENVHLHTAKPERITRDSIVMGLEPASEQGERASGEARAIKPDAIVWATGFLTQDLLGHIRVRGAGGRLLREQWGDTAQAYLGVTVHGFPNFFMQFGPATGLLWGSLTFMFETQALWNAILVKKILEEERGWFGTGWGAHRRAYAVKEDVERKYNAEVQAKLSTLAISDDGCTSFYKNARGIVTTNYPWRLIDYWWRTVGRGWKRSEFDVWEAQPGAANGMNGHSVNGMNQKTKAA